MDYTLELIVVPVSDVDRAKAFYIDRMGFTLEVDSSQGPEFRVVQLTPPGSACSIAIGTGIGQMAPGTLHGLHLCVEDIEAARASYSTFMTLQDPDGNTWLVQEVKRDWVVRPVKREDVAA